MCVCGGELGMDCVQAKVKALLAAHVMVARAPPVWCVARARL